MQLNPSFSRREPCLLLQPVLHGILDGVVADGTHPADTLRLRRGGRRRRRFIRGSGGQTGVSRTADVVAVLHGGEIFRVA